MAMAMAIIRVSQFCSGEPRCYSKAARHIGMNESEKTHVAIGHLRTCSFARPIARSHHSHTYSHHSLLSRARSFTSSIAHGKVGKVRGKVGKVRGKVGKVRGEASCVDINTIIPQCVGVSEG